MELSFLSEQLPVAPFRSISIWCVKIMELSKSFLAFPKRFVGSKSKLGYHYSFEKKLTKSKLQKYMPYAMINASSYNQKFEELKAFGYSTLEAKSLMPEKKHGFSASSHHFIQKHTGVVISLFANDDKIIVSFGALGAIEKVSKGDKPQSSWKKGVMSGAGNLVGVVPGRYRDTHAFVQELLKNEWLMTKEIILTGNCIGGSIASYIALKEGIAAVCINPLPIGPAVQNEIGDYSLSNADKYITNISVKNDWASDLFLVSLFDKAVSYLGIRTPGVYGRRFFVPTQFKWNCFASHTRVLTSLKNCPNS